ncbi:MAG: DUF2515 family protein [Bacillales bacterium]|nr:DUF2515 family protein [Bacillales bacterium]
MDRPSANKFSNHGNSDFQYPSAQQRSWRLFLLLPRTLDRYTPPIFQRLRSVSVFCPQRCLSFPFAESFSPHLTKCFAEGGVDIFGFIKKKKKPVTPPFLLEINEELKKKGKGFKIAPAINKSDLTIEEKKIIQQILMLTKIKNQNNVTRTKSYLDIYLRHPEIHWAFWEHMVSRNGCWNMTDLKGVLLSHLLTEQQDETGEIADDYCETIEKMELAVIAKKAIFY